MTAEQCRKNEIERLAKEFGWLNGFERKVALAAYDAGEKAGRSSMQEEAAQVAERMLNGKGIAAAIRALGKQEK